MRSLVGALIVLALALPAASGGFPLDRASRAGRPSGSAGCRRSMIRWSGRAGTTGPASGRPMAGRPGRRSLVPEAANLDFRDVEAFDASHGLPPGDRPGAASRIFKTTNGGAKLGRVVPQPRPEGVPRRHRVLGPRPRPGARRPGRRPVRDPGDRRRRQDLGPDVGAGDDARRAAGRGGVRRERDLPCRRPRGHRLVRHRGRGQRPGLPVGRSRAKLDRGRHADSCWPTVAGGVLGLACRDA